MIFFLIEDKLTYYSSTIFLYFIISFSRYLFQFLPSYRPKSVDESSSSAAGAHLLSFLRPGSSMLLKTCENTIQVKGQSVQAGTITALA